MLEVPAGRQARSLAANQPTRVVSPAVGVIEQVRARTGRTTEIWPAIEEVQPVGKYADSLPKRSQELIN